MIAGLLGLGVLLIFGGEAFCILGSERVNGICHVILYTGVVLTALGAILEARRRLRR
jgi:hypothetical protein